MTATAIALEELQVMITTSEQIERLCQANQGVGYMLMHRVAASLARRLLATRLQLLDVYADEPPAVRAAGDVEP